MSPNKWSRFVEKLREALDETFENMREAFNNMPPDRQNQLITNASQIICIGLTAVTLSYFYRFLPLFARVALVPALLVGAWWVGTKIATKGTR